MQGLQHQPGSCNPGLTPISVNLIFYVSRVAAIVKLALMELSLGAILIRLRGREREYNGCH